MRRYVCYDGGFRYRSSSRSASGFWLPFFSGPGDSAAGTFLIFPSGQIWASDVSPSPIKAPCLVQSLSFLPRIFFLSVAASSLVPEGTYLPYLSTYLMSPPAALGTLSLALSIRTLGPKLLLRVAAAFLPSFLCLAPRDFGCCAISQPFRHHSSTPHLIFEIDRWS